MSESSGSPQARYPYRAIVEHPPFRWPGGATVAIWVVVNVEHHPFGRGGVSVNDRAASAQPDVLNHSWRDYGPRVGMWRLFDALDLAGVPASAALNSEVCDQYPRLVEEGAKRRWEWIGHGANNSERLTGMQAQDERRLVHDVLTRIEAATGAKPRGWLGPGLAETYNTPDILFSEGVEYVCDWIADDLPFPLTVEGGRLLAMPYSIELNDMELILRQRLRGHDYVQTLVDRFDRLHAEATRLGCGRVMAVPLHPFLTGQAHRVRYLEEALTTLASRTGAWFATGSEIMDHYLHEVEH